MKKIALLIISLSLTALAWAEVVNLAPPVTKQKGPGIFWEKARNAAAKAVFSSDTKVVPKGADESLKINMASPQGYAEWRIFTQLKPGQYTFSAYIKNRTEKKPYLMAYSFNEQGQAHPISIVYGKGGSNDWYLFNSKFTVPANSKKVRIGIGLSSSPGDIWFAKPVLQAGDQDISAMKTASENKNAPALDKWVAEWIWVVDPQSLIPNVIFSKSFNLKEQPVDAWVQVTGDNLYELSVNGAKVGNDADWQTVEMYNISSLLRKGENVMELSVMNFGGPGGVIAQMEAWFKDGSKTMLKTDKTWQHSVPESKTQPAIYVIGAPPALPWGNIAFENLSPPRNIDLPATAYTPQVRAGGIFRIVFKLTESIPADELENLKLVFARDGKPVVISGYDAIITKYYDKQHLAVELPVSRYAEPGKYSWSLKGITVNITAESGLRDMQVIPIELASFTPAKYPKKSTNIMDTPDGKQAPFVYATVRPSIESFFNWLATEGHIHEVSAVTGYWVGPEKWNLNELEKTCMQVLEADPSASFYIRLRVDMPSWWIRQNPDECYLSQKKRRGPQSFASDVWRKSVENGVNALVSELEKKPVGRHLAGVLLMGFKGGEFQLWGEAQGEYDCSPAAVKAFSAWQKEQGISPEIKLPNQALESPFVQAPGYAQIRKTFFRFLAERHAGNLIYFAHKFRERFGKKYQFGVYFGYPMEHAGHKRMLFSGHLGISMVLEKAGLDIISCPASYSLRSMNLSHAYMLPVESALMHNIMPILENDVRNYLTTYAKDSSGSSLPDLMTSINSLNKLCMLAAAHGTAVRYLALSGESDWFQDPPILADIRSINRKVMTLQPAPFGSEGQIVLVLNYLEYCGAAEDVYLKLSGDFLSSIRDPLMRTGRSVAFVTMNDWLANRRLWKNAVFPLPDLLTDEQKKIIAETYGTLPEIKPGDGALIVTDGKISTTSDLRELRDKLATPEALKAGYDVIWYVGGNFKAKYDTKTETLDL